MLWRRALATRLLLIEHAYFADDPRYVAATRERWTRASASSWFSLEIGHPRAGETDTADVFKERLENK